MTLAEAQNASSSSSGVILVRDTTDRQGFTLSVPSEARQTFTSALK